MTLPKQNEKYFSMDLAARIREFRKEKGLTQADLADQVGVARATVINWEKGITRPDAKELQAVAKSLDKDLTLFHVEAKKDDILDHPLVKSYVREIEALNKLVQALERENTRLRGEE